MRKPKINPDYTWFNLEMVKSKIHRIKKGEELTIFYGEGYFHSRNLECVCNSELCFEDKER